MEIANFQGIFENANIKFTYFNDRITFVMIAFRM